jgi:hypothetical protein
MSTVLSIAIAATAAVSFNTSTHSVPTAIFHGFGDACIYPGMWEFTDYVAESTGSYANCIEIGYIGSETSIFENFETQAESACQSILADEHF